MKLITIYFENGLLIDILPDSSCNQYLARFLVSDGVPFDLENNFDIEHIPIPDYARLNRFPNISHSLDYVLKRKAGNLSKNGLFDLSITCLRKANQLMSKSPICWKKRDYFYIVLELARAGKFEEAKKEKSFIEDHYFSNYDFATLHKATSQKAFDSSHTLETDLVEADDAPNCDESFAKYRKRIYSLSGSDKRFPVMTKEIYNSGLLFFPFMYGISRPKYCSHDDMIEYSNRPFVDDRSDDEKRNYLQFTKQYILEERYATDFLEYRQIRSFVSQFCPRSFRQYQEMKFANTVDFQELMQIAEESGIDVEF